MKIGRDGSFARITSSAKGIVPSMKIVEVPEDEKEESGLLYKLVWIGAVENENESSDTSDEELWSDEEDISAVQLPVENTEKLLDIDSNVGDKVINEPLNRSPDKEPVKGSTNQRYNPEICNQNNYHLAERNVNPSRTLHTFDSLANTSNSEEKNYSYNSSNRNSFGTSRRNYNQSIVNASDISPWITPPVEYVPSNFQYAHNQYGMSNQYVPPMEHIGRILPSTGILGDSPYDHCTTIFQQNSPNDNFRYDANYWNGKYHHSDNYQGSDRGQSHFSKGHWNKSRKAYNYQDKNKSNHGRERPLQSRNRDRYRHFQRISQDRNCLLPSRKPDTNSSLQMRRQDANSSSQMRRQDTNSLQMRRQDTNSLQMRRQDTNSLKMRTQNQKNKPSK